MSHCVAVGTHHALLINIANLKVQKNVSFETGEEIKGYIYVYEYFNIYISSERLGGFIMEIIISQIKKKAYFNV